jgi:putative exporter of polyketide antibiotics
MPTSTIAARGGKCKKKTRKIRHTGPYSLYSAIHKRKNITWDLSLFSCGAGPFRPVEKMQAALIGNVTWGNCGTVELGNGFGEHRNGGMDV